MAVPWRWGETPGGHGTAEVRCVHCYALRSLVYRDGDFVCRDGEGCKRRQQGDYGGDAYDRDEER